MLEKLKQNYRKHLLFIILFTLLPVVSISDIGIAVETIILSLVSISVVSFNIFKLKDDKKKINEYLNKNNTNIHFQIEKEEKEKIIEMNNQILKEDTKQKVKKIGQKKRY